ncbi:hypothetical protein F5Y15DRAFT_297374 [Xylariaceae sp. FL0016]|nr:hypothetical protein F5Y15DRAFT_297374 [Xylariaceae sp. FL0016]
MKFSSALVGWFALSHGVSAAAVVSHDVVALEARSDLSEPSPQLTERTSSEELWKRKGGGGGRGGSSGSSSSGGKGGSSSSSSSSGGKGGLGSTSSNTGGRTTTGSGTRPAYGGGAFYGGGATTPYKSGQKSGSITPALLGGAALGFVAFAGIGLLASAYSYPYNNRYYYYNSTTQQNETKPVTCLCQPYIECGCEDNGNQTYFKSIIGDGSYANLNKSLVTVADNTTDDSNTSTIYILGDLPNGTTAAGGTENPNAADAMTVLGFWPAVVMVGALVSSL